MSGMPKFYRTLRGASVVRGNQISCLKAGSVTPVYVAHHGSSTHVVGQMLKGMSTFSFFPDTSKVLYRTAKNGMHADWVSVGCDLEKAMHAWSSSSEAEKSEREVA